jgi:hypothetical protein
MSYLDDLIVIKYIGTIFYVSPDKNKQFYTVESKVPLITTENVPFDKIQEAVQKQCLLKDAYYKATKSTCGYETVAELEAMHPFASWAEISAGNKELENVLINQLNLNNTD